MIKKLMCVSGKYLSPVSIKVSLEKYMRKLAHEAKEE